MTRRQILHLVFNGALLVFLGMSAGFAYRFAIVHDWEAVKQREMRILHTFLVQVGALIIAIGAIGNYLTISVRRATFLVWSLVLSTYTFAAGLVAAAIVGTRGLKPGNSVVRV